MNDITVTFPGGKRVDAYVGSFTVRTDQSLEDGGEGTAPPPFSLCLASLATCAGVYVLAYLQARGLPSEGLKLVQQHEADPKTGKLAKVKILIQIPAGIPQEHHAALIRSAEKCAVKKLIQNPPAFEILAEQGA